MFGQRNSGEDYGPDLNRVVTPMLDMSFQLLFLFIVQFRPMIEEGQLDLSVAAQDKSEQEFQPFEPDKEEGDVYTIHINSIVPKGSDKPIVIDVDRIRHVRFSSKIETIEFTDKDPLAAMEKKLRTVPAFVEGKGRKPPTIRLQVNNKLKYSEVVDLMDRCRKIVKEKNIKDISLMVYPKARDVPAEKP